MKRLAIVLVFSLPFVLGAKGCSESEQCKAAKETERIVCEAAPDSASCATAQQAAIDLCKPEPKPTPTPTPTPTPEPTPTPIVCPPGTTPQVHEGQVVGCLPWEETACDIDGNPGPALPEHVNVLGDAVNEAMATLTGCPVGSRCVLQEGRQAWQARVSKELRRRGLCAGQHAPWTDEIAVAPSPTAAREGWHVYAGSESGPGTVVWSPGAARMAWSAPVTIPDPPPVPEPPSATQCPAVPCPKNGTADWQLKCKPHGRDKVDCTPVTVRQEPFCRAIGMSPMADGTLRAGCPMRPDGHPERLAIETWLTGGTVLDGPGCEFVDGNPFQFFQAGGKCRLCNADKTVCGGLF